MWWTKNKGKASNIQNYYHSYLLPWEGIRDTNLSLSYENEIKKEICRQHPLYGKSIIAVARNLATDDVLFVVENAENMLAVVHPTYKKEYHPDFPSCDFYKDFFQFDKQMLEERDSLYKSYES